MSPHPFVRRRQPRGLSLVEMMVGVAIGLFVVAAATVLVSTQLTENRRLLLETQIQQDLRATADIITRDLRRAGSISNPLNVIWMSDTPATMPVANTRAVVDLSVSGEVGYSYYRGGTPGIMFRFARSGPTITSQIGTTAAQDLTDVNTLNVTAFTIVPRVIPTVQLACPNLCADGTQNCWPTVGVPEFDITITGAAASASSVQRGIASTVRQRNAAVTFNNGPLRVCP